MPTQPDEYPTELTELRDQLKAGLSASSDQPNKEEGPCASEVADKIKPLKAANSIESPPQKHSTAEEPITAPIYR